MSPIRCSALTILNVHCVESSGIPLRRPLCLQIDSNLNIWQLKDKIQNSSRDFRPLSLWKLKHPRIPNDLMQTTFIEKLSHLNPGTLNNEFEFLDPTLRISDYPGWAEDVGVVHVHMVARYPTSFEGNDLDTIFRELLTVRATALGSWSRADLSDNNAVLLEQRGQTIQDNITTIEYDVTNDVILTRILTTLEEKRRIRNNGRITSYIAEMQDKLPHDLCRDLIEVAGVDMAVDSETNDSDGLTGTSLMDLADYNAKEEILAYTATKRLESIVRKRDFLKNSHQSSKATVFGSYITQSPGFQFEANRSATYSVDLPWSFDIIVRTTEDERKYAPKSNVSFSIPLGKTTIPLSICEVTSDQNEIDCWRMLTQALPVVRFGNHLLKDEYRGEFFVVAIYMTDNFVTKRYILYQPKEDRNDRIVIPAHIVEKSYNLGCAEESCMLIRELYNLEHIAKEFRRKIDMERLVRTRVFESVKGLKTLSWRSVPRTRGGSSASSDPGSNSMYNISEGRLEESVFQRGVLMDAIEKLGLENFRSFPEHPWVASAIRSGKEVYLKYIRPDQLDEVQIHLYLSKINGEKNHTIPLLESHETVDGGVILMTMGGGTRLTSSIIQKSSGGRHLRIVKDLFEGVGFMHDNGVQHNDLKPSNIVVVKNGENVERVYIIDYSLATRSRDADTRHSRFLGGEFIGTPGWTAPEVGRGEPYDAVKADIWAAGKVVLDFFSSIESDEETREFIRCMCAELMSYDPGKRPQMEEALCRIKARLLDAPDS